MKFWFSVPIGSKLDIESTGIAPLVSQKLYQRATRSPGKFSLSDGKTSHGLKKQTNKKQEKL